VHEIESETVKMCHWKSGNVTISAIFSVAEIVGHDYFVHIF